MGTTSFDALIASMDSVEVLDVLRAKGYTSLTLQVGRGWGSHCRPRAPEAAAPCSRPSPSSLYPFHSLHASSFHETTFTPSRSSLLELKCCRGTRARDLGQAPEAAPAGALLSRVRDGPSGVMPSAMPGGCRSALVFFNAQPEATRLRLFDTGVWGAGDPGPRAYAASGPRNILPAGAAGASAGGSGAWTLADGFRVECFDFRPSLDETMRAASLVGERGCINNPHCYYTDTLLAKEFWTASRHMWHMMSYPPHSVSVLAADGRRRGEGQVGKKNPSCSHFCQGLRTSGWYQTSPGYDERILVQHVAGASGYPWTAGDAARGRMQRVQRQVWGLGFSLDSKS